MKFVLLFVAFLVLSTTSQGQTSRVTSEEYRKAKFRYVIIGNELKTDENSGERVRLVLIMMEKKRFSVANLKVLFELVARRFKDQDVLEVDVVTDIRQLATPEEADQGWSSGPSKNSTHGKYLWAVYFKHGCYDFFRYSPPQDRGDIKQVELKPCPQ